MHAMKARLVYDGGGEVRIPEEAGKPRADQMQGTAFERVCELGGRLCYDSLGKGRNSADYHTHIKESRHTSVHEHGVFTARFRLFDPHNLIAGCVNRRGVHVELDELNIDITINLRAVNEWGRYTRPVNGKSANRVGEALRHAAHGLAPAIVPPGADVLDFSILDADDLTDEQAHVSLYIPSSRVVGEEFIRHRYSPSKRSTRYCDESESPWVRHPLLIQYLADNQITAAERDEILELVENTEDECRATYKCLTETLEDHLARRGVDKTTARKQARGAARSYLGLGLSTEKLFTAPVSGWRDILRQRLHPAADAEMRAVAASVLDALRESRYRDRFADLATTPSPDGLGVVLA